MEKVVKNFELLYVARFKQIILCLKYKTKYLNTFGKIF